MIPHYFGQSSVIDRLFSPTYRGDFRRLVCSFSGLPSPLLMQERALHDRDSLRPDGWKKKGSESSAPKAEKKSDYFSRHQPWLVKEK